MNKSSDIMPTSPNKWNGFKIDFAMRMSVKICATWKMLGIKSDSYSIISSDSHP